MFWIEILTWLEQNIDDRIIFTSDTNEVHFNCPICNESRHRCYINFEQKKFYCHNCQSGGLLPKLVKEVEGCSWKEAYDLINEQYVPIGNLDDEDEIHFSHQQLEDLKRAIPLPKEYEPIDFNNKLHRPTICYLNARGIADKQIVNCQMGYCSSGKYENRVIIPITENGELKFWVARAISKSEKLKELSPHNEIYQWSKSEVIFNIDKAVNTYQSIVISEGIFDALAWGDIGVSLLGKSMYPNQLNKLLSYRPTLKEIFIALDYDAREGALAIASRLSSYFKVSMIWIPKELDDPNNCLVKKGRQYLYSLLEQAEEYNSFSNF